MTIDTNNVQDLIQKVKEQIEQEKDLSPALKSSLEVLLIVVTVLAKRLGLNSKNSSTPPSADPNRKKKNKPKGTQKPGGQKGHKGNNLRPVENPDIVQKIPLDRNTLPEGQYRDGGYERRQIFDLDISAIVTEYQAEVLINEQGKRFVAPFPKGVSRPAQYGPGVKANSVYMSMFQLIPYNRVEDYFLEQMGMSISAGSIFNFNQEAYELLGSFEQWLCNRLILSDLIHADETGINIGGKRVWLHNASNSWYTYFYPHHKRGQEAMDAMGVIPYFQGILCHDHWKPYYHYNIDHALCNAHHLRELEWAWERDNQNWASEFIELLKEINKATEEAGGCLDPPEAENFRRRYRNLIQDAENDVRMTKVQQKISGCFRSWQGAEMFCRIRSYISTCRKHGVSATVAMRLLFEGKLPEFVDLE